MTSPPPIRVLLADDSSFARSLLREHLEQAGGFEIVAEAGNGRQAVEMTRELRPNLVTMDLEMPVMGGLEAIEEIMCTRAVPILVVSSVADARAAYQAVARGAVDVVNKPGMDPGECDAFIDKARLVASIPVITHVRALRVPSGLSASAPPSPASPLPSAGSLAGSGMERDGEKSLPSSLPLSSPLPEASRPEPSLGETPSPWPSRPSASPLPAPPLSPSPLPASSPFPAHFPAPSSPQSPLPVVSSPGAPSLLVPSARRLLAIASSTGGPQALACILARLPASFPLPVVIAQHIADGFAGGMADWLSTLSALPVRLARDGELLMPGMVYISPSEHHLAIGNNRRCQLVERAERDIYRPSCDTLLCSVAQACGRHAIGLILTGMGHDGARGMDCIRKAGGVTIAQDEASSVIYGMNRVAVEQGAIQQVVPLDRIPQALLRAALAGEDCSSGRPAGQEFPG